MDALKQQLLKVQQQLAGLSASQKMLTASLLVIMVMTLFYWSNFAGTSEMVAVSGAPLAGDDLKNVESALGDRGIKYDPRGGVLYVPAGKRDEVIALMDELTYDGKLSAAAIKDDADDTTSLFESDSVRGQRLQEKRRKRVEGMIGHWPNVKTVQVILAGEMKQGIMRNDLPVASVSIETKGEGGEANKKLVHSVRKQVIGAQPGLKVEDVQVSVDGQTYDADNAADPAGNATEQLAAKKECEKSYKQALMAQLVDIPGVRATVTVRLVTDNVISNEHKVDPKGTATATKHEITSEEHNTDPAPAGEPGMTANTGVSADQSAQSGHESSVEKTEKTNDVQMSYRDTQTTSNAGAAIPSTAVVAVPESYFRRIWKGHNANREPTDADVQAVMDKVLPDIKRTVKLATTIQDDNAVSVATYFDLEPEKPAETPATALATLPTGGPFGAKEIAVGALAVISLFMVAMMVRKSAPQPTLATAGAAPASAVGPIDLGPSLLTVGDIAGEVAEGTMTLAGQELSEEAIQAKQVIEQVGGMVKTNPEVAANLVKRWLNQE